MGRNQGVGELERLAEALRQTGIEVVVRREAGSRPLPLATGAAARRIVQEASTNILPRARRSESLGGRVRVGPHVDGGWRVYAELPLDARGGCRDDHRGVRRRPGAGPRRVSRVLEHTDGIDVVGEAVDGTGAVALAVRTRPDVFHGYQDAGAGRPGTFWYHSHQASSAQVHRGLYGMIIVAPRDEPASGTSELGVAGHFDHAASGMVLHLGYDGVQSPFAVGRATGNQPE